MRALSLFLLLWLAGSAVAQFDEATLRYAAAFNQVIYWDNFEGSPYRVSGPLPGENDAQGIAWVNLKAEPLVLQLPAEQRLRIDFSALGDHEKIQIWASNGSLMARELALLPGDNDRSFYLAAEPAQRLLVIESSAGQTIPLALFLSRAEEQSVTLHYLDSLVLPDIAQVALRQGTKQSTRSFYHLPARQPLRLSLVGPQRLMLEEYLYFSDQQTIGRQSYQIDAQIAGLAPQRFLVKSRMDNRLPSYVNGELRALGYRQQHYLDIPEGEHRLEISSSADLLLRVRRHNGQELLLPEMNAAVSVDTMVALPFPALTRQNYPAVVAWTEQQLAGVDKVGVADELLAWLERSALPIYQALAQRLLQDYFTYRDLAPYQNSLGDIYFRSFIPTSLAPLEGEKMVWNYPQHQAISQLATINRGRFFALSSSEESQLAFRLPQQKQQPRLRIAIDLESITEPLILEMRDQDRVVQRFKVDPAWQVWQTRQDKKPAIASLKQLGFSQSMTMSGGYGLYQPAARYSRVANAEFNLPAQQRDLQLHILPGSATKQPLFINIKQLNSQEQRLAPEHYMGLLDRLGKTARMTLFWQLLQGEQPVMDALQRSVAKQWVGVIRQLQDSNRRYLHRLDRSPFPPITDNGESQARLTQQQAVEAQQRDDWLGALEHWAQLQRHSADVTLQLAALQGRVEALVALSEQPLAERELMRYALLHPELLIREAARQQLLAYYALWGDEADYDALLVASALHEQSDALLVSLLERWASQAKMASLFTVGLVFSPDPRLTQPLLAASYQRQCWHCFDALLGGVTDPQWRAYWRGYKAIWWGDIAQAETEWRQAGGHAENLLRYLHQGDVSDLLAGTVPVTAKKVLEWPEFYQQLPGPRRWQAAGDLAVTSSAGMLKVRDKINDRQRLLHLAEQQKPLTMTVLGPRKLRLKVRLLHPTNDPEKPLDSWLRMKNNDVVWQRPLLGSRPATTLTTASIQRGYPGEAQLIEFDLTAGLNELELYVPGYNVLLDVQMDAPLRPLANYPDPQLALPLIKNAQALPRGRVVPGDASLLIPQPRDWRGSDASGSPEQRVSQLLWWAEHNQPQHQIDSLTIAAQLQQQYPQRPLLRKLARKILQRGRWQLQRNILHSAGRRTVTQPRWQPESPRMRIRNALLAPLAAHEFRLRGSNVWGVSSSSPGGSRWHIALQLEGLSRQKYPLKVMIQLGQKPPTAVTLTPEQPRHVAKLRIPAGVHQLRLWIDDEVSGQLLRVGLYQARPGEALQAWTVPSERSYFVSTVQEPLQMRLKGPQMLRVIERVDERDQAYYLHLDEGWQQLTLAPRFGASTALLRVSSLTVDEQWRAPEVRYQPRVIEPLPRLALSESFGAEPFRLYSPFEPQGHEDGSEHYYARFQQRRLTDESSEQERFLALGAQHRKHHRPLQLYHRLSAELRFRELGNPSLALEGRVEWLPQQSPWRGTLRAKSYWQKPDSQYGQLEWANYLDASIYQLYRLSLKSYHTPRLTLFARNMSRSFNPYRRGWLDQDIFTEYKAQHRYGWRLANRYTYQPWLDTAWTLGGWISSNDSLSDLWLDGMGLSASWRQMVGEGELALAISQRYFLADDERDNSYSSTTLSLQAEWGAWSERWNRWQLQGELNYQLQTGDVSFVLGVSWHGLQGRAYRDFLPGEIFFKLLRQWRLPSVGYEGGER
ncbi:diguanylate cyclase/phosphodiesterase (GGDEF & EAL domains) with PAS/PAC sensor(s) [hydrothermal vent metagenome]|uniref:Diguanylate cyclase/phosphodiesterase (GGDEF & EAL domains) with PAS/PAC sensor(S) n=1 Tax=hydrothermal vent metagenome TaxID=652676 RepID=A0A3B0ZHD6_9ZZZZ